MVQSCLWVLIGLAVWGFSKEANANRCLENWACWEVRQVDGQYEFWVRNKKPYVFTASLDVKASNLRSSESSGRRFTVTQTVSGHSESKLMTLYPDQKDQRARYSDVFYWTPGDQHAEHDAATNYQLPFAEGEQHPLVQGFGGGWSHSGASKYAVDFAMPLGTAVHAARSGNVVKVVEHHNRGGSDRRYAKYANYIIVLHSDGTTGEYYHLKQYGAVVETGETVEVGQLIGYSGNTGFSSLPHLHFAVYRPRPMGDFESIPFRFKNGFNAQSRRSWQN